MPLPLFRWLPLLAGLLAVACRDTPGTSALPSSPSPGDSPLPSLRDVAREVGLDFVHTSGASDALYFVEMMGPGGAFLDFDNDGDLDVFVPQGHALGPGRGPALPADRDRLFENLLIEGGRPSGRLAFRDVSSRAGIGTLGYGVAVATGDADDDGWVDLFVAQWGPDALLRNRGDGTFEEIGAAAGVADPGWGTSATFFDADADGRLDLGLANYLRYDYSNHHPCYAPNSALDYCGPSAYPAEADRFFWNRGRLRFEARDFGPGVGPRPGLGMVAADFDGDGHQDVYVANDQSENHLWLGYGDGELREGAAFAGLAVNGAGRVEASMGLAVADADGDGDEDILITNLRGEPNTYYRNDGFGLFADATVTTGLGPPSLPWTGFGTDWLDVDGDGRLDLVVANGAVSLYHGLITKENPRPLAEPHQLFRNEGDGTFREVTALTGPELGRQVVGRGLAVGDADNDGDPDLLLVECGGPVRLLLNEGSPRRWLGLRVVDGPGMRDALGARVEVKLASGQRVVRRVHTDGSYASARDPRVLLALPESDAVETLQVRWVDGVVESFVPPPPGAYAVLRRTTPRR